MLLCGENMTVKAIAKIYPYQYNSLLQSYCMGCHQESIAEDSSP